MTRIAPMFRLSTSIWRSSLLALVLMCSFLSATARAAEVIPSVPAQYFNDYANAVSSADAALFNKQLSDFERDTSNQIVVAVYPSMQSESDIADYTFRVKETWHVGQKSHDNGAVLFVFVKDHKLFFQVNYGLEGALPDATCKKIIDQEITPRFKAGDYTGGLRAGINSILAATRGEYKGPVRTARTVGVSLAVAILGIVILGFLLLGLLLLSLNYFGGTFYQRHVRALSFLENAYLLVLRTGFYSLLLGGRSASGGGGSRSAGGFTGGGGRGGGGGAGGSW